MMGTTADAPREKSVKDNACTRHRDQIRVPVDDSPHPGVDRQAGEP
jgi:hypothetical protein